MVAGLATTHQPDLILLKTEMPEQDGFQLYRLLKADPKTFDIPILFFSTAGTVEDELRGLQMGAADFLLRPSDPRIIALRVFNQLEHKRHRDFLENQAQLDSLTAIGNRRFFEETLAKEWGRTLRMESPLSLAFIEISDFASFNEHHGPKKGEECLQQVARLLKTMLQRPADTVTRYGPERFAFILPQTDEQGAAIIEARIRAEVRRAAISHGGPGAPSHVNVLVGMATVVPTLEQDLVVLLRLADQRLDAEKETLQVIAAP